MTRKRPFRRVSSRRAATTLAAAIAAVAIVASLMVVAGSAAQPKAPPSRQAIAQHLQKTVGRFMTAPAQAALAMAASGTRQLGEGGTTATASGAKSAAPKSAALRTAPLGAGLTNVRVNNPGEDTQFIDQTTQSETTIAAAGQNVVVGFNDSQTTGLFLTAGSDLSGYSYSTDGGKTFTDGGALPNAAQFINFGDPWLGSDRAGNIYYANLMGDGLTGNLDVGVAKSTDGGKTFSVPTVVSPSNDFFYFGDKDALAVGPDPSHHAKDDIYVAWDDSFVDQNENFINGLPVARSTDGGQTWQVSYANQIPQDTEGCSFGQYIGSTPSVAANGTLYVVAEKLSVDDPNCTGESPFVASEWIFKSTDGGQTFDSGHQLATVTETGDLDLGPGMLMRNLELPAIDVAPNGTVYVAWNDASSGNSNIRLATSTDSGGTWKLSWATSGPNDKVQPALSADGAGVHVAYYQRNSNNTLDVLVGNSKDAKKFDTKRVTSQSFPGVFTAPQFDPIIAFAYMGDYIANVSDGTDQYFAWGDNRDTVTNVLWPKGRHDPNVYFAKQ
jgi:hypothetical protein